MAFEIPGFQRSWIAGGTAGVANSDLSVACTVNSISCPNGYQYMFVRFVGGVLVPLSGSNQTGVVGVLQNKPAPGQSATMMVSGVTRVRSSDAAITVGSQVYVDAFGMVKTAATAGYCVGIAEEVSATAAGYVIAVCLKPFGALAA